MKFRHILLVTTLLTGLLLFPLIAVTAQQDTTPPEQIDLAIGSLSQRLRVDLTLDDLTAYEWSRQEFPSTALGCPRPGQGYTQVITPGYQFLLTYDSIVYDFRVSDDGDIVVLCDTRPAVPDQPSPTDQPPQSACGDEYVVDADDVLLDIARQCNTTVAALLAANPEIEDPDLIYTGQVLAIPSGGVQRTVTIRPDSGPPGTTIRVFASGFPPGAQVELGLGPPASEYVVVGTREIGISGELVASLQISPQIQPPNERVAVVVLNNQETVSEPFIVTEGVVQPTPTPTEVPDGALFEQSQIYLVALGDEGRSGLEVGCGDSLVPVTVTFEPTIAPLTAALDELLAIDSRTYGQSGLYNALYQSDLTVDGIDIENQEAIINLSGTLRSGGVCDEPRILAQLRQTALQYRTIQTVSIFLNGQPLEAALQSFN